MDGPSAQGFLSLTAFQAEGCGLPLCGNAYKVSVTGLAFWVRWHDKHYDDEPPSVASPLWCLTAPPSRPAGKRVTRFSGRFAPLRIVFPCHRGIGRATKGKRLYGQARRLTSPDLHILCRMCTVDNKAPQSNPFTQRIAKNKVPPPGGRWWRQPPKGECISDARRAVVWFSHGRTPGCEGFIQTGAFYKFIGALHNPQRHSRCQT